MDVGVVSSLKSYMNSKFGELTALIANSGGLKYKEISTTSFISSGNTLATNIDMAIDKMAITGIYISCDANRNFDFRIYDKAVNGFKVYDSGVVAGSYSDSLLLLYKDNDSLQKIHIKSTNYSPDMGINLTIKIIGFEMK